MKKDIEIEVRGLLSKDKFEELVAFFNNNGKKIGEKNRVLIDYSTFLEGGVKDRKKDIRLRVTNGVPEIIVKIGEWGGIDQRKELSVLTKNGQFDTLVEIFGEIGLRKGVLCVRKSSVYQYENIEFALVEVPGHSFYFEAEKMASETEDTEQVVEQIKLVCKKLKLEVFTKEDFFKYVETLNKEANEVFDYAEYTPDYFKNRFGL